MEDIDIAPLKIQIILWSFYKSNLLAR